MPRHQGKNTDLSAQDSVSSPESSNPTTIDPENAI